jgi:two-component system alkaline phosphatase synthesis response regulator PhoP
MSHRVFVVDDEPDVVDLLRTILETGDFVVDVATDPQVALGTLLDEPPDLLILDLMMPQLDGFELLKLFRQDPRGARVPVLILSARSGHRDQILSLQCGADAYVCKPFSPRDLLFEIRKLLRLSDVDGDA